MMAVNRILSNFSFSQFSVTKASNLKCLWDGVEIIMCIWDMVDICVYGTWLTYVFMGHGSQNVFMGWG